MLDVGDQVGRYRVDALLGRGGLARVYKVTHDVLGSVHALKLLTVPSRTLAERLLQEGRIQAQLRHPNVVAVTDLIEEDERVGLVMEFVEGFDLEACLVEGGGMGAEEALDIFGQILSGMSAAHRLGVLHRDLKPANVLLTVRGDRVMAKVSDFGIARLLNEDSGGRLTRQGASMGTPGYMAPEQIDDAADVDARADIFSLGVLLYEMLAGTRAFPQEQTDEVFAATLRGNVPPLLESAPNCPPHIAAAVHKALHPDPLMRFSGCKGFAIAIGLEDALNPGNSLVPTGPDLDEDVDDDLTDSPLGLSGLRSGSVKTPEPFEPSKQPPSMGANYSTLLQRRPQRTNPTLTPAPHTRAPTNPTLAPDDLSEARWGVHADVATDAPVREDVVIPAHPRASVEHIDRHATRGGAPATTVEARKPADPNAPPSMADLAVSAEEVGQEVAKETSELVRVLITAFSYAARFLLGPALGVAGLIFGLGWAGADGVKEAAERTELRQASLSNSMGSQEQMVEELEKLGADVGPLRKQLQIGQTADTFDQRRMASLQLSELIRDRHRGLEQATVLSEDAGKDPEAEAGRKQARRNLELKLNALDRAHMDYTDAFDEWIGVSSSITGQAATRMGLAEGPPE